MRLSKVKAVVKGFYWIRVCKAFEFPFLKLSLLSCLFLFSSQLASAQAPVPDFSANVTSGCAPLTVQFSDRSSGNPTFWNWDLGNGQLATIQNPIATYTTPGTYTITLVVRNANGINSITKTNYIVVNPSPSADFNADKYIACAPATIQFSDLSVPNAGSITQWNWNFGDGTSSNQQNPLKTYSATGFYDVILTVTSSTGCTGTAARGRYIRIVSGVTANFSFTPPPTCKAPFLVDFTNQTSGPGSLTYQWDLGNATTSNITNPSATYLAPGTYTVVLTGTSQYGCSGSVQKDIVIPTTTTSFTYPDSVCINDNVSFQNTSSPSPFTSLWDFGNGNSSVKQSDTTSYQAAGNYTVQLINKYSTCTDTTNRSIYVRPKPPTDFTALNVVSCKAPFTVNFQDLSPSATSWLWNFGDGVTSTLQNPTHIYNSTGQFTVTLTIVDNKGCINTISKSSFIRIAGPILSISNAPAGGCVPFTFSPIAAVNAIDGVATYFWDFGDGNTSTLPNPSNTYIAIGNYTIKLRITTVSGCTDSLTIINGVRVGTPTLPDFSASPLSICAFSNVSFTDLSPSADAWSWSFGDGGSSTQQNPTHQYIDTGYFSVTLIAYNNGCGQSITKNQYIHVLPPVAKFTDQITCTSRLQVSFTNTSITNIVYGPISYLWEFGDPSNTTSTVANPVFSYPALGSYTVKLTVTNGSCSNTFTKTVTLNSETADFTVSKSVICKNERVTITALANNSTNIVKFEWSFDGGPFTIYPGSLVTLYNITGPHNITLVITDINGCTDTVRKNGIINVIGPTANFSITTPGGCKNKAVTFNDLSTPTGSIVNWNWNFGDGTTQNFTSAPFNHIYTDTGRFSINLTVLDNNGCTDSISIVTPIWITSPKANFRADKILSCPGGPVQFSDSSAGYGLSYNWNFGDGNTGSVQNPIHTYSGLDSVYSVKLVITDTNSCQDSLTKNALITIKSPKVAFTVKDTSSICPPLETKFTFLGRDYESFYWDFGDGSTSTLTNPTHFYNSYGTYKATLYLTGYGGCVDSASSTINVYDPNLTSSVQYSPLSGCNQLLVDFTITTPPGTRFTFYAGDGKVDSTQRKIFQYNYNTFGFFNPTILFRDSLGCFVSQRDTALIRILGAEPLFGVDNKAFCDTGTVLFANYTIGNDPIANSLWDFGDGNTSTITDPSHQYSTGGTYIPSLTVTTQAGCTKTLYDTVRVYTTPSPLITGDTAVCINETLFLQGNLVQADTAITWKWAFGNGSSAITKNTSTSYSTDGNYIISLEAANKLGCKSSITKNILVPKTPAINILNNPTIPVGSSILLPVTYGPNISNYNWVPANSLNCNNCPVPLATPKSTTRYKVTVTDIYGCTNSNEVTVIVVCNDKNFFIPNTFSPNNDGSNDVFYPRGNGVARVQSMRIFNRWGEIVFERRNFNANDPGVGWDGTYKGKKAELDTYIYLIELICENSVVIPYKGNVTLIR